MTQPPRLVVRTLTVVFITVAAILSIVFMILMVDIGERVRAAELEKLRVREQVFTSLEARRQQEQLAAMTTLAEASSGTGRAHLRQYVGTQFDEAAVEALAAVQPVVARASSPMPHEPDQAVM